MTISGAVAERDKLVLVIGGGYEPDQDNDDVDAPTPIGNSIYIVDSDTGDLAVARQQRRRAQGLQRRRAKRWTTRSRPRSRSSTSTATAIADRMYAADMGGQVWRFDVTNGQQRRDLGHRRRDRAARRARRDGGARRSPTIRRFYYSPDVALVEHADRQLHPRRHRLGPPRASAAARATRIGSTRFATTTSSTR